ncbi:MULTISPECIES: toll/interleukin-1 receptor domain-containing protein [Methylomonas]|uniref:TIR domain-containing protein n=2 Tax=Methylomonas TaxID=416 RepID=A0A140E4X7_9GAMM|nr:MULTISPECIES: toll/interleukin-1 receptor domain-containing protein [Methylomonas]AMK75451.1 hypothetical protein JT25_002920 [Methylomonas denitrificans]OAI07313.1 hypothetical protein A1342_19705 [Methylomonas methanica]TCV71708.1 TIR domain-containing protein [Methylomonas methanica]
MSKYNLFLSHSSDDKEQVRRLAKDLEVEGFKTWLDEWEILVGYSIVKSISQGIKDSDFFAVWLTQSSVNSGWVQQEWYPMFHDELESGRVRILPLLAESCELPVFFKDKRYADFRHNYINGFRDLISTLKKLTTWDQAAVEQYLNAHKQYLEKKFEKLNEHEYIVDSWVCQPHYMTMEYIFWDSQSCKLSKWGCERSIISWYKLSDNLSSNEIARVLNFLKLGNLDKPQ